eukprot:7080400-Heterocapsa_arctica.AAC.1
MSCGIPILTCEHKDRRSSISRSGTPFRGRVRLASQRRPQLPPRGTAQRTARVIPPAGSPGQRLDAQANA